MIEILYTYFDLLHPSRLRRRVQSNSLLQGLVVMISGASVAQLITLLAAPVLTRLYLPADFGILQIFFSFVVILTSVVTWKYELAIPLPDSREDAINLIFLCLSIAVAMSMIFYFFARFLLIDGSFLEDFVILRPYLPIIILSTLFAGMYQTFSYWFVREREYKTLAQTRFVQTAVQAIVQIGCGVVGLAPAGLLLGDAIGRFSSSGLLARRFLSNRDELASANISGLLLVGKRYKRFPLVSSFSNLLNTIGIHLPALMIGALFGVSVAGLFALGQRVMAIPMVFIGQAISKVYFSEGALKARHEPSSLQPFFQSILRKLSLVGVVPILIASALAPFVFGILFGPSWDEAGLYILWLSPMFIGQFIASPLSQTLNIIERQDLLLGWDIFRLLMTIFSLLLGYYLSLGPILTIGFYSIIMFFCYAILLIICNYSLKKI